MRGGWLGNGMTLGGGPPGVQCNNVTRLKVIHTVLFLILLLLLQRLVLRFNKGGFTRTGQHI